MNHNYTIHGNAFSLRPVTLVDAEHILELRTDVSRAQFLNRISSDLDSQHEWLKNYFKRENDYYFTVIRNDSKNVEGFISLYDIIDGVGEIGRWILAPNSLAAPESIFLIYKFAFGELNLVSTFCRTLKDNQKVVSFHNSYGARTDEILEGEFLIDNEKKDAVRHVVTREDWSTISPKLHKYSYQISQRIIKI